MIIKSFIKKFFKPPPQVFLPYTLNRKRIYILPTRHGFLFLLVLLGMLMGCVNYENNVGFLLTFLLGGMAFISIFHTYKNMAGIQVISAKSDPAFAGESAVFHFNVNADISDRAAIVFHLQTDPLQTGHLQPSHLQTDQETSPDICINDIYINKDNKIKISILTGKRGILKPGLLKIYSSYPLGLFYAWSNLYIDNLQSIVYPRPVSGPVHSSEHGSSETQDKGKTSVAGVDDFEGLRIYQSGDSLQHISWKAYSKGQGLMTKSFVGQTGTSVFLDWDSFKDKNTEQKLSRLCDMILKTDRLNLVYGLKLPGKIIEPGSGNAHKHNCLKELALFGMAKKEQDISHEKI
ncbi:DUF58 domain-containing protein [Desulfobacterales bacterium HSG17]|nr:DUF58 domain-containing protein [Desulfobacterales bacterium HSG17]